MVPYMVWSVVRLSMFVIWSIFSIIVYISMPVIILMLLVTLVILAIVESFYLLIIRAQYFKVSEPLLHVKIIFYFSITMPCEKHTATLMKVTF